MQLGRVQNELPLTPVRGCFVSICRSMKLDLRCPRCGWDIRDALKRGDDYCPRCGFEFTRCAHCGADARQSLQTEDQLCDACHRSLKPAIQSLPDDPFWNSPSGQVIHVLILLAILGTGVLLCTGILYLIGLIR